MKKMLFCGAIMLLTLSGCGGGPSSVPQSTESHTDGNTPYFVSAPTVQRPSSFRIAAISRPDSWSAGQLSTVMGTPDDLAKTTKYAISDNVLRAQFSPDGQWLAVVTSTGGQSPEYSLWLMSSDGTKKSRVPASQVSLLGEWMANKDVFVYGAGQELLAVEPDHVTPQKFGDMTDAHTEVRDIRFSPDGKYMAVLLYTNTPQSTSAAPDAFDKVELRDLSSGKVKTLMQSTAPDGLKLGPWAADSQSLFYWPDPLHSGSLIADGSELSQVDLQGHTNSLTSTLTESGLQYPNFIMHTVFPYQSGDAVLQTGDGREIYRNKWVGLYEDGHVTELPKLPNQVGLSPTVTSDGALIAFAAGPQLENQWGNEEQLRTWENSFTMDVYDSKAHKLNRLTAAGMGVRTPLFTADGKHLVYAKGSGMYLIDANGQTPPAKIADFGDDTFAFVDFQS